MGTADRIRNTLLQLMAPVTASELRAYFQPEDSKSVHVILHSMFERGLLFRCGQPRSYAYALTDDYRLHLLEKAAGKPTRLRRRSVAAQEARQARLQAHREAAPSLAPDWPAMRADQPLSPVIGQPWRDEEDLPPVIGERYADVMHRIGLE
jgi:hypothetical protein